MEQVFCRTMFGLSTLESMLDGPDPNEDISDMSADNEASQYLDSGMLRALGVLT
jgi:hypothetical protein